MQAASRPGRVSRQRLAVTGALDPPGPGPPRPALTQRCGILPTSPLESAGVSVPGSPPRPAPPGGVGSAFDARGECVAYLRGARAADELAVFRRPALPVFLPPRRSRHVPGRAGPVRASLTLPCQPWPRQGRCLPPSEEQLLLFPSLLFSWHATVGGPTLQRI